MEAKQHSSQAQPPGNAFDSRGEGFSADYGQVQARRKVPASSISQATEKVEAGPTYLQKHPLDFAQDDGEDDHRNIATDHRGFAP